MNSIKTKYIGNTALLFLLLAPFTILFYASYVFNPVNAGNIYLYILQIIADAISITTIGTLWITILLDLIQPEYHKRTYKHSKEWLNKVHPTIDILIPVRNEPIEIIETTVKRVVNMEYPHNTFLLDDGPSVNIENIAKKYKIAYIARPHHAKGFAKSGNLNYGLKHSKSDFFAVFDADHAPKKEFIVELLPFMENEKIALVQSPQYFINTDKFIASGTTQAQEVFYKYVQPAKNSYNASFCVGTNMILRRHAIDSIGGIVLMDHSEDIWTTILLHQKGYETIFFNKILAEGRAPETIHSFFRQQNRWAQGGFSLFFSQNPLFAENLTTDQKLQYLFSNIHYFSAFSILIYILLPIIYLLFGIHPMDVLHDKGWLIHYIPYFLTIYFIPLFLLGSLKLSTISVSLSSFAPYITAFFSVLFNTKYTWVTTGSSEIHFQLIMTDIWPHVFIIILSFLAVLVGWYNPQDVGTTVITTIWVLINAYFLFLFVKNGIAEV